MRLTLDEAMLIYQRAIGGTAGAGKRRGLVGGSAGRTGSRIAAPTTAAATDVIAWWHQVWKDVGDTPARVASRISQHAASVLGRKKAIEPHLAVTLAFHSPMQE